VSQAGNNPVDVIDMRLSKIVKLIRGKKGTEVRLTVIPAASDPSERKLITLQRDVVKLTETLASAEIHDVPWGESMTVAIGVIELTSFYGPVTGKKEALSTTHDLEELILKLKDMNIQGLILDLRRNGGGFLNEAITTTGLFIPKGPVVQVKDATGRVRENWDRDPAIVYDGPLIVLVSRRSASASEIVAGALQNHRRALIVGDTATHGKGTVQKVFELDRSQFFNREANQSKFGATKITTQKFYLPNGESTQKEGVRSDIVIPSINDHLPIGESDLPNALIWDSIAPLNWDDFQDTFKKNGSLIEEELIESLRNDSLQRQDTLEEFSYLKRNIDWFKERQERKQISLNFEIRSQQKKEDTTFREEMETIKNDLLSMDEFPFRKVLLELSLEKKTEHQSKLKQSLLPNGKPKANNYYQKVFYFQPEGADEIKEVWVEQFDYEKAFKQSEAVAHFLSEKSGAAASTPNQSKTFLGISRMPIRTQSSGWKKFSRTSWAITSMKNRSTLSYPIFSPNSLKSILMSSKTDPASTFRYAKVCASWLTGSNTAANPLNPPHSFPPSRKKDEEWGMVLCLWSFVFGPWSLVLGPFRPSSSASSSAFTHSRISLFLTLFL